jgi:tRNA pseudouridine55 synthase
MTIMDGVFLIDKDVGVTSHDVVDGLRRVLKTEAVGHAGTLDPLATGLLICLVGEATKLSQYVMNGDKEYRVGIRFGLKTDSGDITGNTVVQNEGFEISREVLEKEIQGLTGPQPLNVPKFSAVKIKGKKLYEYARKNEEVEIPTRIMRIHSARLIEFQSDRAQVEMACEKGTYVRSWVEKLGEIMGTGATVESLRRLRSGPFTIERSRKLAELAQDPAGVAKELIPLSDVLMNWPALKLLPRDQVLVKNGQLPRGVESQIAQVESVDGVRLLDNQGRLLALVTKNSEKGIKLARVFKG